MGTGKVGQDEVPQALARFLADELGVDEGARAPADWSARAALWRWQPQRSDGSGTAASWHFLTIAGPVAEAITAAAGLRGGFGSIKVEARIGATMWRTSLFPHKDSGGFLLPVKASVRRAEHFGDGDVVEVRLVLVR